MPGGSFPPAGLSGRPRGACAARAEGRRGGPRGSGARGRCSRGARPRPSACSHPLVASCWCRCRTGHGDRRAGEETGVRVAVMSRAEGAGAGSRGQARGDGDAPSREGGPGSTALCRRSPSAQPTPGSQCSAAGGRVGAGARSQERRGWPGPGELSPEPRAGSRGCVRCLAGLRWPWLGVGGALRVTGRGRMENGSPHPP